MTDQNSGCIICSNCKQEIDPEMCWCGEDRPAHDGIAEDGASPTLGHTFVPIGCDCYRDRRGER